MRSIAIEEESMDEIERRKSGDAGEYARESMGRALGVIPSGIFVVTTARDAVRAAYVGSWIQQAAFDPPSITVEGVTRDYHATRPSAIPLMAAWQPTFAQAWSRHLRRHAK